MGAQALDDFIFLPFFDLFLDLLESEVHDIVMMQLLGRQNVAKAQPQTVQKIYFVGRQVRGVRPEDLVDLVAIGQMNFEVELRLDVAEFSQASPIWRACSSVLSFAERPITMVLDRSEAPARSMPSQR